jgi:uncharacterized membrane protein YgcG
LEGGAAFLEQWLITYGKDDGGIRDRKISESTFRVSMEILHAKEKNRKGMRATFALFLKMHGANTDVLTFLQRLRLTLSYSSTLAHEIELAERSRRESNKAINQAQNLLLMFDSLVRQFGVSVMNVAVGLYALGHYTTWLAKADLPNKVDMSLMYDGEGKLITYATAVTGVDGESDGEIDAPPRPPAPGAPAAAAAPDDDDDDVQMTAAYDALEEPEQEQDLEDDLADQEYRIARELEAAAEREEMRGEEVDEADEVPGAAAQPSGGGDGTGARGGDGAGTGGGEDDGGGEATNGAGGEVGALGGAPPGVPGEG